MGFTALRCLSHRSVGGAGERGGGSGVGRRGHRRAGPGAVTRRGVVAPVALELSAQGLRPTPHLGSPPPPPTPRRGREGRGAAARAQRAGGGAGRRGREARALSLGRPLRETGGFRAVPAWDPRPCLDFISRHGGAERGGEGEFPASFLLRLGNSPVRLTPSCTNFLSPEVTPPGWGQRSLSVRISPSLSRGYSRLSPAGIEERTFSLRPSCPSWSS